MGTQRPEGTRRFSHLGSEACLDANDMIQAIVYPCQSTLNKKQQFVLEELPPIDESADKIYRVILPRSYLDQGRTHIPALCLTAPGRPRRRMRVSDCASAPRWRKLKPFEP